MLKVCTRIDRDLRPDFEISQLNVECSGDGGGYTRAMDITLTKTGDYAVRAAIALASSYDDGRYVTIAEVAERMALPRAFTPQILGLLAKAGIAESKAGRGGGYRLARDPGSVPILEVVEAAEGSLINTRCTLRGGPCGRDDRCPVHDTWMAAGEAFRRALAATSLADVALTQAGAALTS
jgi:Rrf2 family iron-sulfur cluster assembly transcriptional regulator